MKLRKPNEGFTVIEVAVSAAIILVIFSALLGMTDQTQRLMSGTSSKVEQFQDARLAFEAVTRRVSQATLNTYWDYQYQTVSQTVGGKTVQVRMPSRYERGSDLRFRSGPMTEINSKSKRLQPTHGIFFQAPNGVVEDTTRNGAMDHLLNSWGYFLELNSDEESLPTWLRDKVPQRERFRLMELMEPSEQLGVYQFQQPKSADWFLQPINRRERPVRALADNVVALIFLPRLARADEDSQRSKKASSVLAPHYRYDSTQSAKDPVLNPKHQLPPIVQVVMVAIDEPSAQRLAQDSAGKEGQGLDYADLFTKPELLEDDPKTTTLGDGDLWKFTAMLANKYRVTSRVFSTNVSIRGAKWSRSQEN